MQVALIAVLMSFFVIGSQPGVSTPPEELSAGPCNPAISRCL